MKALLLDGRLVDVALVVLGLEFVVLVALRRRSRRGLGPLDLVGQLLAGAFLLLAVRAAAMGQDYRWTLALVSASFPAHIFDLARRSQMASPS